MAVRSVDVSALRIADSGACVDTSPASAVRCTISVLRVELRRIVLRAHVVNDTAEPVRCAPGTKRDAIALLQTDLDLLCDPHAELGFLFAIPRFGRPGRRAFVRVSGTTFACGFAGEIADDERDRARARAIATSIGIAAILVAIAAGVIVYERRSRRTPIVGELVEEAQPASAPPAVPEGVRGIGRYNLGKTTPAQQAREFAAVVGEERVVMGALECTARGLTAAEFVAKVVNQAQEPLLCSVSGWTRRGPASIAPGTFWVHPQSAAAVTIAAPLRFPWRLRSLSLQMENSSLRATAQAEVPVSRTLRVATAAVALFAVLAAGAAAAALLRPAIQAFALPPRVLAGDSATASYALSGFGTARYDVRFAGATIASGIVPSGNGSFTFATLHRVGLYSVDLRMAGPLGSVHESRAVAAVAHPVPTRAAIDALAVDPAVAAAGAPIEVRYVARADSGRVALLDAAQIALQSVPYRSKGVSVLRAPPVETPTQYQVVLEVVRGGSTMRASVGLLVLPKQLQTPPPSARAPTDLLTASQLLQIAPAYVVSAHRFAVQLFSHPANLHLTLQDDRGTAIATQKIAGNAVAVEFEAPYVARARRFVIVASFTRGTADQVILEPMMIHSK